MSRSQRAVLAGAGRGTVVLGSRRCGGRPGDRMFRRWWRQRADELVGFVVGLRAGVAGLGHGVDRVGLLTGCVVCNDGSAVAKAAEYPVEIVVGPEFLTGSTRMKSGTAQKLALNMISTSVMIRLGKVKGNKMVDMQLTNEKLVNRALHMIIDELNIPAEEAQSLLDEHGSVRAAIEAARK